MGVGYVPPGSVCQERQSHDVPRRKHRRARADLRHLEADLSTLAHGQVGKLGEAIAAWCLRERGATIVGRNVRVGRGELDLLILLEGRRIAVEVKTALADSEGDPIFRFDAAKRRQVFKLGRDRGANRIDYVGVELGRAGVTVKWLPNVA